ncbi:MAG: hypothetical protein ACHQUC_01100 [Chlamydiales bacterium]
MAAFNVSPSISGSSSIYESLMLSAEDVSNSFRSPRPNAVSDETEALYSNIKDILYRSDLSLSQAQLSRVLLRFHEIIISDLIQHDMVAHRRLSKVYRIFVELFLDMQFQALANTDLEPCPLGEENRRGIIVASKRISSRFTRGNATSLKFHYYCTQEGATLMNPTKNVFKKLSLPALKTILASISSPAELMTHSLEFLKQCSYEWPSSEYMELKSMFWSSWLIISLEEFQAVFPETRIKRIHDEGLNYAICYTICLKNIIKNPRTDPALRTVLIKGTGALGELTGLAGISHWKESSTVWSAVRVDKYLKASSLAKRYLNKLKENPLYKHLIEDTLKRSEETASAPGTLG